MLLFTKGRNFALNPGEGLKIVAFKNCHTPAATMDRELVKLGEYLVKLAAIPDFRTVDHKVREFVLLA
jgi:ubiquitin-like domain-containing CTD phosphatase 1